MLDSRTYQGEWYVPDAPGQRVAGTLTYEPNRYPSLVATGPLGAHPYSGEHDELVLGETTSGARITLWRCIPVPETEILGLDRPHSARAKPQPGVPRSPLQGALGHPLRSG